MTTPHTFRSLTDVLFIVFKINSLNVKNCALLVNCYNKTRYFLWEPVPVAAHLLRSCVRIPPGAWMFVCCACCMLSGRGPCDELITRLEEAYRLCCVLSGTGLCDELITRPVESYRLCVVCCQVEVSATSWSLVRWSPTDCAASLCVI